MNSHTAAVLDRLRAEQQMAENGDKPIMARSFRLAIQEIDRLNDILERIAAREPEFNSLPMERAFRTLREITQSASAAISAADHASEKSKSDSG